MLGYGWEIWVVDCSGSGIGAAYKSSCHLVPCKFRDPPGDMEQLTLAL